MWTRKNKPDSKTIAALRFAFFDFFEDLVVFFLIGDSSSSSAEFSLDCNKIIWNL